MDTDATSHTSTLAAAEAAWDPAMRRLSAACAMLSLVLALATGLGVSGTPARLAWLASCLVSAALHASNLRYLRQHERATIGMGPVAIVGTLPSLAATLLAPGLPLPLRVAACVCMTVPAAVLATFGLWFVRLWLASLTRETIAPDAALIVLGGVVRQGHPGVSLALRLDVAARLWREQPTRTLVTTGGPSADGAPTEAEAMARYLAEQGVDPQQVLVEPTALNTRQNVERSLALLRQRGCPRQICVVSNRYHLYRALREACSLGVRLVPVAAPTPAASALQQWSREVLTILAKGSGSAPRRAATHKS